MEADLSVIGLTATWISSHRHQVSRITGRASYTILFKDYKVKKFNSHVNHLQ